VRSLVVVVVGTVVASLSAVTRAGIGGTVGIGTRQAGAGSVRVGAVPFGAGVSRAGVAVAGARGAGVRGTVATVEIAVDARVDLVCNVAGVWTGVGGAVGVHTRGITVGSTAVIVRVDSGVVSVGGVRPMRSGRVGRGIVMAVARKGVLDLVDNIAHVEDVCFGKIVFRIGNSLVCRFKMIVCNLVIL